MCLDAVSQLRRNDPDEVRIGIYLLDYVGLDAKLALTDIDLSFRGGSGCVIPDHDACRLLYPAVFWKLCSRTLRFKQFESSHPLLAEDISSLMILQSL